MKVFNLAGVSKGLNYLWHIEGKDKHQPFGLCIHGAINGFSRKVLWLNGSPSSKHPTVISKFFLDFVSKMDQQELL